MTKKVSLSLTVQEWGVVSSVLSNAGRLIDAKGSPQRLRGTGVSAHGLPMNWRDLRT